MRALITGATGLVGGNLALMLRRAGHEVLCIKRPSSRTSHLDGHGILWRDTRLDAEALTPLLDGVDVLFHCAAQVSVSRRVTPLLQAANVDGTREVIEAVRRSPTTRLVHCSTVGTIGLSVGGQPSDETAPWNFAEDKLDDGYATTKKISEDLVLTAAREGLDAVVVNPTYMFGPYDAKPSSGAMILAVITGRIFGYTDGVNDFVDVRDVARGMIAAAERGRAGERYILSGHGMPYRDIFATIADIAGCPPPRRRIPRPVAAAAGACGDIAAWFYPDTVELNSNTVRWGYNIRYIFTSAKAQRELGYTISPIAPAIEDAISWFRNNHLLDR